MTPVATADVERELRAYHLKQSPPGRAPAFTFWPADAAVDCAEVEALDQAGECQSIALDAARRFGLGVCLGWSASDAHPERPVLHWWNVNGDGELIDAARSRRVPTGYLGAQLSSAEVIEWREAIEQEARMSGAGLGLRRMLAGLLG